MPFEKGFSGNPNGRKKGKPNKSTEQIRGKFEQLVEGNLDLLDADIKSMKPRDRVKAIIELSKFVLPTLRSTTIEEQAEGFKPIQITGMEIK